MTPPFALLSRRVVLPDGTRPASSSMPGVVDSHVHVNETGRTERKGFETAMRSAAAGSRR